MEPLDLFAYPGGLTFERADEKVFRTIGLAYEASRLGGSYPVALNAANEVLVAAFLQEKIRFIQIQEMLEDILEEIVGEIRDEDDMDEDEDVQRLKDGRYIVDPLMTLSDLSDELGIELEPPENSHVETLSGLIQATLGIIPSPGAEVKIQGYTFRVLKMDGTRMEKVMLILPPGKAGPKTQALKKI
jgi:hypothetical protein